MISLPMFDQFVLVILQVLVLYSLAHLKLHSHLQPFKLHLRLWIHLYVSPFIFQAMDEELSALHKTNTWDLVPLPPSKSVVGCRWVYKIKTNSDGSIERYKVRLAAKGYS